MIQWSCKNNRWFLGEVPKSIIGKFGGIIGAGLSVAVFLGFLNHELCLSSKPNLKYLDWKFYLGLPKSSQARWWLKCSCLVTIMFCLFVLCCCQCSKPCGGGYRTRDIFCIIPRSGELVENSQCSAHSLPPNGFEYCNLQACECFLYGLPAQITISIALLAKQWHPSNFSIQDMGSPLNCWWMANGKIE